MATITVTGSRALKDADVPSPDKGTRGEAQIDLNPKVDWVSGTAAAAEVVDMVGEFEPTSVDEMDTWLAASVEDFDEWEAEHQISRDDDV